MASRSRLLHLPFKDPDGKNNAHVLLHVSSASPPTSDDSSSLDLELLATQGTEAFVTTLQHRRVSRYRDDSSCSEQEWEKHLVSLLVSNHPISDFDVLAENKEPGYLNIDLRKKTSGRAQRLGTLRLRRSNQAAKGVDVFGWCVDQVIARAQLERQVEELQRKHAELEKLVAEETAHFQELERGKRDFEALHDSFCRDLINEKKLKIRTLEQVLATAKVDREKLSQAATSSSSSKRHTASTDKVGAPRKGKRKAEGPEVDAPGSDEETDDGVDKMDVDESDQNVGMTTPETASESESEPVPKPKPKSKSRASPQSTSAQSSRKAAQPSQSRRGKKATPDSDSEDDAAPEPPRGLPVNKKPAPAPDPADDESTASE